MSDSRARWLYWWPDERSFRFRIGRSAEHVVAEWLGLGALRARVDGSWKEFVPVDGVSRAHAESLLHAEITALVRHLSGDLTLHASSVARGGRAVVFLGSTFAGKSTIAALLCRDENVELVSDDSARLRFDEAVISVDPFETEHSIRPDVASAFGIDVRGLRRAVQQARRAATKPAYLGALVSLVFDDAAASPNLARIQGSHAFSVLSQSIFRFVLDRPDALRSEFDKLALILAQAPMYELRRSRALCNLDACASAVARLLGSALDQRGSHG